MADQYLELLLKVNAEQYEKGLKKASGALDEFEQKTARKVKSVYQNQTMNTANLAAQFQDIAVTMQMGQNPLQIALQQGTQIASVLGPMGAAGGVKALGSAFMSLISPVSLLTIGTIAAGAALTNYLMKGSEVRSVEEIMESHAKTVTAIKEAWGKAREGAADYLKRSLSAQMADVAADAAAMRKKVQEEMKNVFAGISSTPVVAGFMPNAIRATGEVVVEVEKKYKAFEGALRALHTEYKNGNPDIQKFIDNVNAVMQNTADDKVKTLGLEMINAAERVRIMNENLQRTPQLMSDIAAVASGLTGSLNAVGKAISTLEGIGYKTGPMAQGFEAIAEAAESVNRVRENIRAKGIDPSTSTDLAAAQQNFERVQRFYDLAQRRQQEMDARAEANKNRGGGTSNALTTGEKDFNKVVDYINNLEKTGRLLEAEVDTLGKSNAERMKAVELARLGVGLDGERLTITAEQNRLIDEAIAKNEKLRETLEKARMAKEALSNVANYAGGELVNALDGMITRGEKLKDVLDNIVKSLIRAALQATILGQGPLAGIMGTAPTSGQGSGGLASLFEGWAKGLFGRASGGLVSAGQAYRVGESGPETFVPGASGTIVPNHAFGRGAGLKVVINNTVSDQAGTSVRESQGPDGTRQLEVLVEAVVAKSVSRNGGVAKILQNQYGLSRSRGR